MRAAPAMASAKSDLFELGAIAYELLTGRSGGDSAPPSVLNPELPPRVDPILARALAHEADERYTHARDLVDDLGGAIRLPAMGDTSRKPRQAWLHGGIALAFVAAIVALVVALLVSWRGFIGP